MRCAKRISERIGDTEIAHLSGWWSLPRHTTPYLVYVTESKRWSPAVLDQQGPLPGGTFG